MQHRAKKRSTDGNGCKITPTYSKREKILFLGSFPAGMLRLLAFFGKKANTSAEKKLVSTHVTNLLAQQKKKLSGILVCNLTTF